LSILDKGLNTKMMKLLLVVAVVVTVFVKDVTPLGQQCYQCITRHPSWTVESCKEAPVTCALGAYCTKTIFGGSLVVRGCAPGGVEKEFKEGKICKKTLEYFTSNHVSNAIKTQFQNVKKVFEQSCPPGNALKNLLKKKEPKKGFTCKKKLCNAGGRTDAAAVSVMAAVAAAIFATKHF